MDEFQDTDSIQGEILRLLSGSEFLSGRLFVVGDVKQSIYRFRGAEPSIFRHWRSEFPQPGRLSLTENFRSVPGVIRFVNALFGDCFGDLEPTDVANESGGSSPAPADPQPGYLPAHGRVPLAGPRRPSRTRARARASPRRPKRSAHERRMIEARCLARRLRERLDAGWPVFDRATNATSAGAPRRRRAALPRHDRPVALRVGPGRRRVRLPHDRRLGVLRPAGGPRRDQPALGRRGPVRRDRAGRRVAQPVLLRQRRGAVLAGDDLRGRRADRRHPPARRDRRSCPSGTVAALRGRSSCYAMAVGQGSRRRWRRWWPGSSTSRASRRRVVCEFLGERKLANTRKIVRLARDFDRQGGFTLAEFVARLRADLENEPREEQAATTDEAGASIRLMSIHQAKGLEFPIVVLPDLAQVGEQSRARWSPADPELGLVVRPVEASPGSIANPEPNPTEPTADLTAGSFAWQAYLTLEQSGRRAGVAPPLLRGGHAGARRPDPLRGPGARRAGEIVIGRDAAPRRAVRPSDGRLPRPADAGRSRPAGRRPGPLMSPPVETEAARRRRRACDGRIAPGFRSRRSRRRSRGRRAVERTSRHRPVSTPRYLDLDPASASRPARRGSMR